MPRFGFVPGEFGVDRRPHRITSLRIDTPFEKVGNSSDAVVKQRHLKHDVNIELQGVSDVSGPISERLTWRFVGDTVDVETCVDVGSLNCRFVRKSLVEQQPSERSDLECRTTSREP